jgi:hypothetical protein
VYGHHRQRFCHDPRLPDESANLPIGVASDAPVPA